MKEAIFEFSETVTVEEYWFAAFGDFDYMAVIFKEEHGPWKARYRFRYYTDGPEAFNNDKKRSYEARTSDSSDHSLRKLKVTIGEMVGLMEIFGARVWHNLVQGNPEKFFQLLKQEPWCHYREESPGGIILLDDLKP